MSCGEEQSKKLWDEELWDEELWDEELWDEELRDEELRDEELWDEELWDEELWDEEGERGIGTPFIERGHHHVQERSVALRARTLPASKVSVHIEGSHHRLANIEPPVTHI